MTGRFWDPPSKREITSTLNINNNTMIGIFLRLSILPGRAAIDQHTPSLIAGATQKKTIPFLNYDCYFECQHCYYNQWMQFNYHSLHFIDYENNKFHHQCCMAPGTPQSLVECRHQQRRRRCKQLLQITRSGALALSRKWFQRISSHASTTYHSPYKQFRATAMLMTMAR